MIPAFVAHHPHAFAVAMVLQTYLAGMALVGYLARRAHALRRAAHAARTVVRFFRGCWYLAGHKARHARPAEPRHLLHHAPKEAAA